MSATASAASPNRPRLRAAAAAFRRARWLPPLAGLAAAIVGAVNLASTLTPNIAWRGHLLLDLEPVEVIPVLHALAVPAGVGLLVAAFYLARRRRRALRVAIALLVVLGVLDLFKGFDFEVTLVSWALAALLYWGRDAFVVRHDPFTWRASLWRIPLISAGAVAVAALTAWAASGRPGFATVMRETGDLLLLQHGPLHFHGALRALPAGVGAVSVLTFLAIAYLIFRPLAAPRALPDRGARATAGELVREYGEDTLSFFKLRQDKHYLFSRDGRAFVGYRVEGRVMLLSGDPVGPADALPELLDEVEEFASSRGLKLGALGASERLVPLYEERGLRCIYLGDEAIVDLGAFSLEGRAIRKIRQSVSRMQKAGYSAELIPLGEADEATLREIEHVLEVGRAGAPERGFSMAMDTLRGDLVDDTLAVIARDEDGRMRGVLHFVPCYQRAAVSLSFMRRDPSTPNGLTEFLVVRAIELLRERGVEEMSLNFAAFARWMHSPAHLLERIGGRLATLFNPFFQIESLYRFNAKFFPRWEPRYLVCESAFGVPRVGLAAAWVEGHLPKPGRSGDRAPQAA
jgi:lysyl-tRNA synthetase class 2